MTSSGREPTGYSACETNLSKVIQLDLTFVRHLTVVPWLQSTRRTQITLVLEGSAGTLFYFYWQDLLFVSSRVIVCYHHLSRLLTDNNWYFWVKKKTVTMVLFAHFHLLTPHSCKARNQEKAMSMLNRWVELQKGENAGPGPKHKKRPYLADMVDNLNEAVMWRQQLIKQIAGKVLLLQNGLENRCVLRSNLQNHYRRCRLET